jgi:predicted transposase YdaD
MPEEEVPDTLGLEDFQTMLAKRVEEWNEKLLERGRQEGELKGRQEGRKEGRQEGEAGVVLRLLERKFGSLDARSRKRVMSADEDRLLDWAERTLVAETISDVFGKG